MEFKSCQVRQKRPRHKPTDQGQKKNRKSGRDKEKLVVVLKQQLAASGHNRRIASWEAGRSPGLHTD
ncbi:hypothetical protein BaRGS_00018523 [Batillaria attramentaria]|uniref:Uncharacterized protein n=1 Tax=Batillaria attramentaria TaxID=370345 RepID=A0ABD0KSE1_9CAEN